MLKAIAILAIISAFACSLSDVKCPVVIQTLDFYTGSFSIGDPLSAYKFKPGVDTICINYSLPTPFASPPGIVVAFTEFQSQKTSDLFGSVKPVLNTKLGIKQIPFQVRTQWKYTTWVKISVNFLAETREDVEAAYHQVDTGAVGGCGDMKIQRRVLPLSTPFNSSKPSGVIVLLTGFQIISITLPDSRKTPFEVRLRNANITASGIQVQISTSTQTQVSAIHIGSVAYNKDPNDPIIVAAGKFEWDKWYQRKLVLLDIPIIIASQQQYVIYGFSAFSISQDQVPRVSLKSFSSSPFIQTTGYVRMEYAIFYYPQCLNCPGYSFLYKSKCYQSCPPNAIQIANKMCSQCPENTYPSSRRTCSCNSYAFRISHWCLACESGSYFNGTLCVPCGSNTQTFKGGCRCKTGFYSISGVCIACEKGTSLNGSKCICQNLGEGWNGSACVLPQYTKPKPKEPGQCGSQAKWNGVDCYCAKSLQLIWNGTKCVCLQLNRQWDGQKCIIPPKCPLNSDWKNNHCACKTPDQYWNGIACIPSTINPEQCTANISYWNGAQCICLFVGHYWDSPYCIQLKTASFKCPQKSYWNGSTCKCFQINFYWNGSNCADGVMPVLCPPKSSWNGRICVCNIQPKSWYRENLWNGESCIEYSDPRPNCDQPNTYWNLSACVCIPGFVNTSSQCKRKPIWNCNIIQNSFWNGSKCECNKGYVQAFGQCAPKSLYTIGDDEKPDEIQQKDLNRSECHIGFHKMNSRGVCSEICGDGKRFILLCDDNNTVDGDGCSSKCEIESGWDCAGGSPKSRDYCKHRGSQKKRIMRQTAQNVSLGKLTATISLDWMPITIQKQISSSDLFKIYVKKGGPLALTTRYLPGTGHQFEMLFDFKNKQPVKQFSAAIRINPKFQKTYFPGIDASQVLEVMYDPKISPQAMLAKT